MKKKNKRGFFLSETMVVIAIVSVVLLTVFKIFSSVYIKYKESENYNTVNATNAVVELRKFYQATEFDYNALLNGSYYVDLTNSSQYDGEYYENLKQVLKVDKVYLVNMATVFSGTNINVFNTSLRKYLKTMQGTESTVMLVVTTDGNQYGSVTVVGGDGAAPILVGDSANEYEVIVPLNGTFTDPGYTNWFGDAPTTTWEATLNTAVEGTYYLKYNFDGYILRRKVVVAKSSNAYDYTGSVQTFTVPITGYYYIELYGAQGGESLYTTNYNGGNGGYTSGYISLTKGEVLYIYVGGKGQKSVGTSSYALTINGNGYNGGGYAAFAANNNDKGGGGGATDIRFFGSTAPSTADLSWNSTLGLNSRIMVAGGGGGSASHGDTPNFSGTGGLGGSLVGGNGIYASTTCYAYGTGGSQIAGGTTPACPVYGQSYTGNGAFGIGNTPYTSYNTAGNVAGGGGGYYGGGGGYHAPAGGGSSFISGYAGVNAITSSSSTTATNNTKHYSGKYFINGSMIAGVNTGNGSAKITYYGTNAPTRVNTKLNNVRYIKDCATGNSTGDLFVSWREIQAISNGVNVAYGKSVTGTVPYHTSRSPYSTITDGIVGVNTWATTSTQDSTSRCVTVDLGSSYNLDEIAVWHAYGVGASYDIVYYNNITSVSNDNSTWTTVIANTDAETNQGKRENAYTTNFFYTGGVQTFTAPVTGYYSLEAWGGQGGYATGIVRLNVNQNIYIYVGGKGSDGTAMTATPVAGGYNGGGNGFGYTDKYSGGGGGATHIATTTGLLSTLSSNQSTILLVAGGGGGASYETTSAYGINGHGGGYAGVSAQYVGSYSSTGGTQSSGGTGFVAGSFGQGAIRTTNGSGGGGGGYYGGGSAQVYAGASGGSGYIANSLLLTYAGITKAMYCYNCTTSSDISTLTFSTINVSSLAISNYAKIGNGAARITYLGT